MGKDEVMMYAKSIFTMYAKSQLNIHHPQWTR